MNISRFWFIENVIYNITNVSFQHVKCKIELNKIDEFENFYVGINIPHKSMDVNIEMYIYCSQSTTGDLY